MTRLRRCATRCASARVALRAARSTPRFGVSPPGALRRFGRAFVRAVDGAVPATEQEATTMTNIVLLVGNLGADPELRSASNGTDIASFSVGTSRPKRDS